MSAPSAAFLEGYLRKPPKTLLFPPFLERRFLVRRALNTRKVFFLGGMAALILLNVWMLLLPLADLVAPGRIVALYLASQGIVVPVLTVMAVAQRWPAIMARMDALMLVCFTVADAGFVMMNRQLVGDLAVNQIYLLTLLPVVIAVMFNLRFVLAAPTTLVTFLLFSGYSLQRPDFPISAKICIPMALLLSASCALLASYRLEVNERKNFLINWRDRMRAKEIEDANRRLDALSRTDGLTELANRREFDRRLAEEVANARNARRPLTVIVLDIDHFKAYNDRLGHPQGDKCIKAVAQALAGAVGPAPNFAGRIGGEEFAAVLPGAPVEAAAAAVQGIRYAVEALQLPHVALGERRVVSVSLGVACLNPGRPETPETLLARADSALYRAKRAGRDRAEFDLKIVGN